jgi:predicted phosphodiesterase
MRIAALYDIHGNLPALDAVLDDARRAGVDRIVVGGDVIPGPMPAETLDRLLALDIPVDFIHGNGELAVVAQIDARQNAMPVTYWGTTSGDPLPEPLRAIPEWTSLQLRSDHVRAIRSWPRTVVLDIPPLGPVLFCHATPRSETEAFTRLTAEDLLVPLFAAAGAGAVVCGHTHMQFDRRIGATRVINAGSVGMPFGSPGADWLLIAGEVKLQRTEYDRQRAAALVRTTGYPQAQEFAERNILDAPSEAEVLVLFTNASFR